MFKIGDKVRVVGKCICPGDRDCLRNQIATIESNDGDDEGEQPWRVENEYDSCYFDASSLEPSTGKRSRPSKPRPVKFLLKYDLDEDPIEEFETMEQVTDRIDYLVKNESSLKRDSMIVYEIKSKKTVSVQTKIKLSK